MSDCFRVQVISDKEFTEELKKVGGRDWESVEDHKLPSSDQNFGLAEAAAIIAVAHSVTKLVESIVDVWKKTQRESSVTIKTPRGSVTISSVDEESVGDLVKKIESIMK